MKEIRNVTRCEFCDTDIDLASPPLDKYYATGRIYLEKGSVLLLNNLAKATSHAAFVEGYYCNVRCLIDKIIVLRK